MDYYVFLNTHGAYFVQGVAVVERLGHFQRYEPLANLNVVAHRGQAYANVCIHHVQFLTPTIAWEPLFAYAVQCAARAHRAQFFKAQAFRSPTQEYQELQQTCPCHVANLEFLLRRPPVRVIHGGVPSLKRLVARGIGSVITDDALAQRVRDAIPAVESLHNALFREYPSAVWSASKHASRDLLHCTRHNRHVRWIRHRFFMGAGSCISEKDWEDVTVGTRRRSTRVPAFGVFEIQTCHKNKGTTRRRHTCYAFALVSPQRIEIAYSVNETPMRHLVLARKPYALDGDHFWCRLPINERREMRFA